MVIFRPPFSAISTHNCIGVASLRQMRLLPTQFVVTLYRTLNLIEAKIWFDKHFAYPVLNVTLRLCVIREFVLGETIVGQIIERTIGSAIGGAGGGGHGPPPKKKIQMGGGQ